MEEIMKINKALDIIYDYKKYVSNHPSQSGEKISTYLMDIYIPGRSLREIKMAIGSYQMELERAGDIVGADDLNGILLKIHALDKE